MITTMSRSLRQSLAWTLAAALAGSGAMAALATPSHAAALTTIKTRTSTTTIYAPGGVEGGATGGPVAPSNVPTTGKVRIPQIKIHVRTPGATLAPSTKAASPTQGTKAPAAPTFGGTAPGSTTPAAKAPVTPLTSPGPLGSTTQRTPAPAAAHSSSRLSTGAILLAALAALLALTCAAWLVARALAIEPHWTLSARHALSEASFRASSTWAEFSDWVRLGH